jgi:serine/threonine-protein kinase
MGEASTESHPDDDRTQVFDMEPMVPLVVPTAAGAVPGYEILATLGRGGMGVVYKARHLRLNRLVALKMIGAESADDPAALARFHAEAVSLAHLQHPNIVQIFEVGVHEGRPFLALEFVEGGTLAAKVRRGLPTPRQAAQWIEIVARAVDAAHQRGIVHRDLKPSNILLTPDGQLKVSDFGLAKNVANPAVPVADALTRTGEILGTPDYMAPEQAAGRTREAGPISFLSEPFSMNC